MKTLSHALLVLLILFALPIGAKAVSSDADQIRFLNEVTSCIDDLATTLREIEPDDTEEWSNLREVIAEIMLDVAEIELPEHNTPVYDVIKYSVIMGTEAGYNALDPTITSYERIELLLDGAQYMFIVQMLAENADDIVY